jgi:glycosyltransferase involved in cell wall biosynthesis
MMDSAPLFSVVIPAYNCESTVASAIRSALDQTEPSREVIVVDDGSRDGTAASVESIRHDDLRLIRQANRGVSAARNAGIAVATGRFVAFLDGDDLWLPTYLQSARRALVSAPAADVAYTDAYAFDAGSGRVLRQTVMHPWLPARAPTDSDTFLLELIKANFIYNSATISRQLLDEVHGFDETMHTQDDYDLWLRLALRHARFARMDEPQGLYRMHPGQKSRNLLKVVPGLVELLHRIPIDELPSEEHRRVLAQRRREEERELRILTGKAPVARAARWPRPVLGRLLLAAGLRKSWYAVPPPQIAAAFPDLRSA